MLKHKKVLVKKICPGCGLQVTLKKLITACGGQPFWLSSNCHYYIFFYLFVVDIKHCWFQYPVAVKTCTKCKHSFYLSKKDITPKVVPAKVTAAAVVSVEESKDVISPTTRSDGRRRTERVRREKPNYYDASAFIRKTRVS